MNSEISNTEAAVLFDSAKQEAERLWREITSLADEVDDYTRSARGALTRAIKAREKVPFDEDVREWFQKISDSIGKIYTIKEKINEERHKAETVWQEIGRSSDLKLVRDLEKNMMKGQTVAKNFHSEARRIRSRILNLENWLQAEVLAILDVLE